MAYATVEQVEDGFRELKPDETSVCTALLDEAAIIIDAYNVDAPADVKRVVSCRRSDTGHYDGRTVFTVMDDERWKHW